MKKIAKTNCNADLQSKNIKVQCPLQMKNLKQNIYLSHNSDWMEAKTLVAVTLNILANDDVNKFLMVMCLNNSVFEYIRSKLFEYIRIPNYSNIFEYRIIRSPLCVSNTRKGTFSFPCIVAVSMVPRKSRIFNYAPIDFASACIYCSCHWSLQPVLCVSPSVWNLTCMMLDLLDASWTFDGRLPESLGPGPGVRFVPSSSMIST